MHIGLIGGIGPAATVSYYTRLTKAVAAQGMPLNLTIVQADITTLIANTGADRRAEQAAVYAGLVDRLKAAGAECAAITSLGGHFCYAETAARAALPLVSALSPLDAAFAAQGIGSVGLLGTRVVMRTRLYGALTRTRAFAPDADIDRLGDLYIATALQGHATEDARAAFFAAGRAMMAAGAEAIVLAGTDLNLAFDGHTPGFPVIDALDIHVAVLADLATGRRTLAEIGSPA